MLDINLVEGLTLDSVEHKLYWTDALRRTIETVYVNGSKRRVLVSHDLDRPRAIAVDPNERYLFINYLHHHQYSESFNLVSSLEKF